MRIMKRFRGRRPGAVLAGIDLLVTEELYEVVVSCCEASSHHGSQPVDPVVMREALSSHCGTEAACRVEGAAGEEDALRELSVSQIVQVT